MNKLPNRARAGRAPETDNLPDAPMPDQGELIEIAELLFFAYRDFISDPDEILEHYGFGRAHHRVIHFVGRHPGIRVAELLTILRITKQSLGRVLKELVDTGYVEQREGPTDRRRRLLFLTPAGCDLHRELMAPQLERIARTMNDADEETQQSRRSMLFKLIDQDDQAHVSKLLKAAVTDCNKSS